MSDAVEAPVIPLDKDVLEILSERNIAALRKSAVVNESFTLDGVTYQVPSEDEGRERTVVMSMQTGLPHLILKTDRPRVLRKVLRGTNDFAFWVPGMPGKPPKPHRGTVMCYLHPDHPEREWMDKIGLQGRTCNLMALDKHNRADLRSDFDLVQHMKSKHKDEFAAIELAKTRERDDEDRARSQSILEQLVESKTAKK